MTILRWGRWCLVLFAGLLSGALRAESPVFAPEFNFRSDAMIAAWQKLENQQVIDNPENLLWQEKFRDAVQASCKECVITEIRDKYGARSFKVAYPDGWYFELSLDPSVIEVVSRPLPLAEWERRAPELERDIFENARKLQMRPDLAGHVNIGVESAFGQNSRLLHDFIADFLNHAELAQGALNDDDKNSPHPANLLREQHAAFDKFMAEFDPAWTPQRFAQELQTRVYYRDNWNDPNPMDPPAKYQALNVTTVADGKSAWPRLEIRAIRAQGSLRDFILQCKLFSARLDRLRGRTTPLAYARGPQRRRNAARNVRNAEVIRTFHAYVTGAGLKWEEYRELLPSSYAWARDSFESQLAEHRSCRQTTRVLTESPSI